VNLFVREETAADRAAIRDVVSRAFGQPDEADLVEALRQEAAPFISLVATDGARIVGHICFSPVTIGADSQGDSLGLAPMAVAPEVQRCGVGSRLVRIGLDECGRRHARVVVVLGHTDYYPRFGFVPARPKGLTCEYPVPDAAFMVIELAAGGLSGKAGLVRYHPAFARF
jgi:putative acetyltransferase